MAKQFTLGKNERLKSRKQIEQLFREGKKITVFPFTVYFVLNKTDSVQQSVQINNNSNFQFGTGVSARNFKKAVDRNKIKRLIREAFRLQKLSLQEKLKEKNFQMNMFFIFTDKELPVFKLINEKVAVVLKKLLIIIDENISSHS